MCVSLLEYFRKEDAEWKKKSLVISNNFAKTIKKKISKKVRKESLLIINPDKQNYKLEGILTKIKDIFIFYPTAILLLFMH